MFCGIATGKTLNFIAVLELSHLALGIWHLAPKTLE
jgi:hypothetical protein